MYVLWHEKNGKLIMVYLDYGLPVCGAMYVG